MIFRLIFLTIGKKKKVHEVFKIKICLFILHLKSFSQKKYRVKQMLENEIKNKYITYIHRVA